MGTTTETRISSTQAKDAIYKAHSMPSASGVNRFFEKRHLQGRVIEGSVSSNLFDMSNITVDASVSNIILENSNDNTILSTKTLKLGSSVAGASTGNTIFRASFKNILDMSETDLINLNIYVPTAIVLDSFRTKNWGYINLYFTNVGGTNGMGVRLLSENISLQRGNNCVQVHKSQLIVPFSTGFDWSLVGGIRIVHQSSSGHNGMPIYLDSISIVKSRTKPVPICITLDDGVHDVREMSIIASQYGIPTTHFIIPTYIQDGTNGYMSMDQLKQLHKQGHSICMHETGINSLAWEPEKLATTIQWFKTNGFTRKEEHLYVAYPNGGYSRETMTVLNQMGMLGARTTTNKNRSDAEEVEATKGVEAAAGDSLEPYLFGIAEEFQISGSKAQLESYFKASIDAAITHKMAYITCHHFFVELDKTTNSDAVGRVAWLSVMKYLREKEDLGLIECLTFPEFVEKYRK